MVDLPLSASPVALHIELEAIEVVGTVFVAAADPVVQHAHAPDVRFATEVMEKLSDGRQGS